jgi:hypothetical protein
MSAGEWFEYRMCKTVNFHSHISQRSMIAARAEIIARQCVPVSDVPACGTRLANSGTHSVFGQP